MKFLPTLALLGAILLAGCDDFDPAPAAPQRSTSLITVTIDPNLKTDGWAHWKGNTCLITLRRYPVCLGHEVRHCLEGHFHPEGTRSGEDCY